MDDAKKAAEERAAIARSIRAAERESVRAKQAALAAGQARAERQSLPYRPSFQLAPGQARAERQSLPYQPSFQLAPGQARAERQSLPYWPSIQLAPGQARAERQSLPYRPSIQLAPGRARAERQSLPYRPSIQLAPGQARAERQSLPYRPSIQLAPGQARAERQSLPYRPSIQLTPGQARAERQLVTRRRPRRPFEIPGYLVGAADTAGMSTLAVADRRAVSRSMRILTNGNAGNLPMSTRGGTLSRAWLPNRIIGSVNTSGMSRGAYARFVNNNFVSASMVQNSHGYDNGRSARELARAARVSNWGVQFSRKALPVASAGISAFNEVQKLPKGATNAQKIAAATVGAAKELDNIAVGAFFAAGAGLLMLNPIGAAAMAAGLGLAYGYSPIDKYVNKGISWAGRRFLGGLYK